MLAASKFTVINEDFTCLQCGFFVMRSSQGCRNHCPKCLYSLHVDVNPGDRENSCGALMRPIGYETSSKKGIILTFKCTKCGSTGRNKAMLKDQFQSDELEKILQLGG